MTQVIDYERFRSIPESVQLYNTFKKEIVRCSTLGGRSNFTDLLPPGSAFNSGIIKHYFYMSVIYSFEHYGRQVYRLGTNLAQMFSQTKLPKLSLDDVATPYPCFYVSFPEDLDLWVLSDGGRLQAHGCYIFNSRDPDNIMNIKVMKEGGDVLLNEINFVIAFFNYEKPGISNDQIRFFSLKPGESDLENYIKGLGLDGGKRYPEDHGIVYQRVARLALNLVFYLNSSNREIGVVTRPDERRIESLERELRETRPSRERIVKKLQDKLDREKNRVIVTKLAPSLEEGERSGRVPAMPTGRTVRRHWVPGFYNYYWCNNRDAEGNKIEGKHVESRWIKPYKRGTAIGQAIRSCYDVQDLPEEDEFL